jgi:demethylmenaquinone methyltransferase/2-methoxy-6-polyprenyl-1,4-benzoquinol methylase
MLKSKEIWLDDKDRKEQLAESADGGKPTYFGYERVTRDQKTDRVIAHFNSVARHYDFMNSLLSFGIHHLWKRTAVEMMNLTPGNRILDICGGTADLAILAARDVGPDGTVIVYDINRAMIQSGLHKVASKDFASRIGYVQGNAEIVSFPDNHFDATMVGFGIRNVTNMSRGFVEMYRVLKPGGKMMCLEFSRPTFAPFRWLYDLYSFYVMPFLGQLIAGSRQAYTHLPESIRMFPLPDELADLLTRIGFSQVTYRSLTNGIAVIHLAIK